MNILVAPNTMKGSLSAFLFADIVEKAFHEKVPGFFNIRKLPVADGGDLTAEVLTRALNLNNQTIEVAGPLLNPVMAEFGFAGDIAVIEMANASGMKLLRPKELNPMKTSSFGTGQLMMEAIRLGAKKLFIGVGGSATVDGGMGMLEALGVRFQDSDGNLLAGNGANLTKIADFDISELNLPVDLEIKIICDVDNPLLGEKGASRVFGPQKGATNETIDELEAGLTHFAELIKSKLGMSVDTISGGGAAGGITAGMVAFLDAEIAEGANFVLDTVSFDEHAQWADLVITGEGRIDSQTLHNKAPFAVAVRAKKAGAKVIAIGGSVEPIENSPFDGIFSIINKPCSLEYAMENADALLENLAGEIAKMIFSMVSVHS